MHTFLYSIMLHMPEFGPLLIDQRTNLAVHVVMIHLHANMSYVDVTKLLWKAFDLYNRKTKLKMNIVIQSPIQLFGRIKVERGSFRPGGDAKVECKYHVWHIPVIDLNWIQIFKYLLYSECRSEWFPFRKRIEELLDNRTNLISTILVSPFEVCS